MTDLMSSALFTAPMASPSSGMSLGVTTLNTANPKMHMSVLYVVTVLFVGPSEADSEHPQARFLKRKCISYEHEDSHGHKQNIANTTFILLGD